MQRLCILPDNFTDGKCSPTSAKTCIGFSISRASKIKVPLLVLCSNSSSIRCLQISPTIRSRPPKGSSVWPSLDWKCPNHPRTARRGMTYGHENELHETPLKDSDHRSSTRTIPHWLYLPSARSQLQSHHRHRTTPMVATVGQLPRCDAAICLVAARSLLPNRSIRDQIGLLHARLCKLCLASPPRTWLAQANQNSRHSWGARRQEFPPRKSGSSCNFSGWRLCTCSGQRFYHLSRTGRPEDSDSGCGCLPFLSPSGSSEFAMAYAVNITFFGNGPSPFFFLYTFEPALPQNTPTAVNNELMLAAVANNSTSAANFAVSIALTLTTHH